MEGRSRRDPRGRGAAQVTLRERLAEAYTRGYREGFADGAKTQRERIATMAWDRFPTFAPDIEKLPLVEPPQDATP